MSANVREVHPSVSRNPIPLDAEDLSTVCVLCSHNCGIKVDVEAGRIVKIRGDETSPITGGYVCNKAFSIQHYVEHEQRVEYPMRRRRDGGFEKITWDEAITEISARLVEIRDQYAPRSIALCGIGGQANHMDAPYATSFMAALGSTSWFNAFAQEKTQHFLISQWMFDAAPGVFFHPDIEHTDYLLLLGTNPRISNRGHNATDTFNALAKSDTKLVVADPRETETTRQADVHLRVKPGTDSYLLMGIAATIASGEGLADAKFIHEKTVEFERLRSALQAVDVDEMARRCGLTTEQITDTAANFARAGSASIMWDLAVEQQPFSTLISYLMHAIATMTGNVGNPGGMIWQENQNPPERSPKRFEDPVRALASGTQGITALGGAPMFSPNLLPEEIMHDHPERIRAMIVEGSNPYLSFSDTAAWREARKNLDLMVVIEPAMTETARDADYVLPVPVGYEKWENAGFPKGFPEIMAQVRPPVVPGPEEALPEPEIYVRIAEAMGLVPPVPEGLDELARDALTPAGAEAFFTQAMVHSGGSQAAMLFWGYRTLGPLLDSPALTAMWVIGLLNAMSRRDSVLRTLGDEWAEKSPFELGLELFRRLVEHPEGVEIGRVDPAENLDANIGWEDGKVRMAPEAMLGEIQRAIETAPATDPEFPLVLAGGLRTNWTANTIQRNREWRKGRGPHCALNLSPTDAETLGIESGDQVRVSTRRGSVELPAAVDKKAKPGHVWIPNGFGMLYPTEDGREEAIGVNLNELADAADRDPFSGCPHHKYLLCKVEKLAAA